MGAGGEGGRGSFAVATVVARPIFFLSPHVVFPVACSSFSLCSAGVASEPPVASALPASPAASSAPPAAPSAPPAPPPPPAPYVWYFAYGSNMSPQVLGGRRQVWPLRSIACRLPGHALNFASLGLPYAEPGFGSVERIDGRPFELYELGDRVQSAREDEEQWQVEEDIYARQAANGKGPAALDAVPLPTLHQHAPSPCVAPAPMRAIGEVQGVAHLLTAEQWLTVLRTEGDAGKRGAYVYSVAKVRVEPLHGGGVEDERRPEDEEEEEEAVEEKKANQEAGEKEKAEESKATPPVSASAPAPSSAVAGISAFSDAPLVHSPVSFTHPSHTPPSSPLPPLTTSGLPTRPTGPFPAFTLVCSRRCVAHLGDRKPLPSKRYLSILRQGAAHIRLEPSYVAALESVAPYTPRTRLAERLIPFFRNLGFGSIRLSERISKRAAQALLRVKSERNDAKDAAESSVTTASTLERPPGIPPPGPSPSMHLVAAIFKFAWILHDLVLVHLAGSGLNND